MESYQHSGTGIRLRERASSPRVPLIFLFLSGCCLLCPKAIEDWPAQQGVVVDADTGEPLAGAYVIGRWRGYVSSHSVCFPRRGHAHGQRGAVRLPGLAQHGAL